MVLDAWAVVRLLEGTEPAAMTVHDLLERERPVMSWINLGEVFYVVRRAAGEASAGATVRDVRAVVDAELPAADRILGAARVKAEHPLSHAGAFACATALAHGAELWTGDPELLLDGAPWRWRDLRR